MRSISTEDLERLVRACATGSTATLEELSMLHSAFCGMMKQPEEPLGTELEGLTFIRLMSHTSQSLGRQRHGKPSARRSGFTIVGRQ